MTGSVAFVRSEQRLQDLAQCIYARAGAWGDGTCGRPRLEPGEIGGDANDNSQVNLTGLIRSTAEIELHPFHHLRFSVAPTLTSISGEERVEATGGVVDPVEAERTLFSFVGGAEYELRVLDERLTGTAFAKIYTQAGTTQEIRGGQFDGNLNFGDTYPGGGIIAAYELAPATFLKASYEYATRLPNDRELFGVPGQIQPNTGLAPERSHNANLGIRIETTKTAVGMLRGEINGFYRDTTNLVRPVGNELFVVFANVGAARSVGVETSSGWISPGRYLSLDGSLTYMDFRNTAESGPTAARSGSRIPNFPYFFGAFTARLRFGDVALDGDEIGFSWTSRLTDAFFVSWEDVGRTDTIDQVEGQIASSANLGYRFSLGEHRLAASLDAQNLFDEPLFDFFGVQRPGRAFYVRFGYATGP